MLAEARAARDTIAFALPPSRIDIEPGDAVTIDGRTYRVRRLVDGAARVAEAVAVDPSIHLGAARRPASVVRPIPALAGKPLAIVLNLAAAHSGPTALQSLAVAASPWPGGYTLWRSDDGASFEPVQRIATAATIGETTTALAAGPLWRVDRRAAVEISLSQGSLQSVSLPAALGGANMVAVEGPPGAWEILAFTAAEILAAGRWRLSGLIRGLAGSEPQAATEKAAGARLVLLDGAIVGIAGTERLNRPAFYRLSSDGRDHADPLSTAFNATPGPAALLPLAPVHLRARREEGGVRLSWIRRTRFGGDNWELAEAPLNEERELYSVEIMSSDAVRSFEIATSTLLYAAADEIADLGSPQARLDFRVAQISASVGAGHAAMASVSVR